MSKILLIEDEVSLLESIVIILEASGLEAISALNGRNGLELLRSNADSIDLILCDVNLPDVNGYEILKEVKADNVLYKIPFIFLTAYADEKDIRIGMNMGADDYMTKPFSAKELIKTINARITVKDTYARHTQVELNKKWLSILNASFKQEFFTPINGILNASIMLGNEDAKFSAETLTNTVQAIYSSSFRMYRNARNLMLYSLISADKPISIDKHPHSRSAYDILTEVLNWFQNSLIKNKLNVNSVDKDVCLQIIDNDLLSIVFTELIDNALKFNTSATQLPIVSYSSTNEGFAFSVTNTISNTINFNLDNVQPFTKFHKDETYIGLGLGLFLCINIANKIGYKLSMSTNPNSVTFTISH
jgi:CheY-like chemotaxis protein